MSLNHKTACKVLSTRRFVGKKMVRINPFCDSDFRNGLQFLSGVNLMMCVISFIVDVLAIAEVSHFFANWDHEDLRLSPSTAELILILDLLLICLQILYGLKLYHAVAENAYSKIQRWKFPSGLILGTRVLVILIYCISMPSSAYFYYFTSIGLIYSAFIFWPVRSFLSEMGSNSFPSSETSRLLGCVN